ncbi:MAG TPA: hypothetical protein VFQ38_20045 [Longimicrobiales bacterium]|nr:hypothetical protein [Longimicrobiales bacterium]
MSQVAIVGAYNTRFGARVRRDAEGVLEDLAPLHELLVEAGRGAIADAGLEASEIDGVWIGSCSPGLLANQEHLGPLATEIDAGGLLHKRTTRTEAACASSSVALYDAVYAVEAGRCRHALVIGVEKMNLAGTAAVTRALACSSYWPEEGGAGMTFPGVFAVLARAYQAEYALDDELFARMRATVAALSYRNGARNPIAHFGPDAAPARRGLICAEAILALPPQSNPIVAAPLRLHDCSPITDGAAALVVASASAARGREKVVELAGIGHAAARMPLSRRDRLYALDGARAAALQAYAEAGVTERDLEFAEVHDCFTNAQLLCVEALGLSAPGRAGFDYLDGRFTPEDRTPVNLSGGLKAKGHPVGATGASMHVHAYRQLVGEPLGVPHPGRPEVGAVLNVGGSGATNCVSILRRVR